MVALPTCEHTGSLEKPAPRFEYLASLPSLALAWSKVRQGGRSPGVDGVTIDEFNRSVATHLGNLSQDLALSRYVPLPLRAVSVPKTSGGERILAIPTVRDRIVARSVLQQLSPTFEALFLPSSFGFRSGRGTRDAHRWLERTVSSGFDWAAEFDLMDAFGTVEHARIARELERHIADARIVALVLALVRSGLCRGRRFEPCARGCPQGSPLSPLLCNVLLHRLDDHAARNGWALCRYADDFVVCVHSAAEGHRVVAGLRAFLQDELGMVVHPAKTRVCRMEGLSFLGGRMVSGRFERRPRPVGILTRLARWIGGLVWSR